MAKPKIVLKSDGTILLGCALSCDGFSYDHKLRVQTHIHHDHMIGFDTSKANQTILMSDETKQLLFALKNADLPHRSNIKSIPVGESYRHDGVTIKLLSSHHMLGSVQVEVEEVDGYRYGYSSDFFWPMDDVIQVNELLVDATYGSPDSLRSFRQDQVDDKLIDLTVASLRAGRSTALIGYHGRVEQALNLLGCATDFPIVCSPKIAALLETYRRHGYAMPEVVCSDSLEGLEILRDRQLCLAFVTLPEQRHLPWVKRFAKITLSAFMTKMDDPIMDYGNGDYRIAYTDHADFEGTLKYIEKSGASKVWTDPRSGNAEALAIEVRRQLGIDSSIVTRLQDLGWG